MFEFLIILLVVLNLLDIYTTCKIMTHPNSRELNPVMAKSFEKFGVLPGLILNKAIFFTVLFSILYVSAIWFQLFLLVGIDVVYVLAVWNNFIQIKLIKNSLVGQ